MQNVFPRLFLVCARRHKFTQVGSYSKYLAVIVEITLNITPSVYVHVYTHMLWYTLIV